MTKTRDSFPDILRGFALLGIAMVNVQYFATDTISGFEMGDLANPANSAAMFIVAWLFQSKFYLLFSFLFGYSAHYVMRGEKSNRNRWVGRSIGLILLGVIHFVFFFFGDILFLYGIFALVLLAFYFRKERTIKRWAITIFSISGVLLTLAALLTLVGESLLVSKGKAIPTDGALVTNLNEALASGTFLEIAAARFEHYLLVAPQGFLLQGPLVLVAFLVGVLVSRKDGLGAGADPERMKRYAKWGLLIGLPLQGLAAYLFVANAAAETYSFGILLSAVAINFITAPILSAGYVGALWLLARKLGDIKLLSAAGRHSLSIYLGQSVVFSVLFSAWGVGLFAELEIWLVAVTAALVWLGLSLLAVVNLRFRDRGPMEVLLTNFSRLFVRKS